MKKQLISLLLIVAIALPQGSFAQQAKPSDPYADHEANIEKAMQFTQVSSSSPMMDFLSDPSAWWMFDSLLAGGAAYFFLDHASEQKVEKLSNSHYAQNEIDQTWRAILSDDDRMAKYLNLYYSPNSSLEFQNLFPPLNEYIDEMKEFTIRDQAGFFTFQTSRTKLRVTTKEYAQLLECLQYAGDDLTKSIENIHNLFNGIKTYSAEFMAEAMDQLGDQIIHPEKFHEFTTLLNQHIQTRKIPSNQISLDDISVRDLLFKQFGRRNLLDNSRMTNSRTVQYLREMEWLRKNHSSAKAKVKRIGIAAVIGLVVGTWIYLHNRGPSFEKATNSYNVQMPIILTMIENDPPAFEHLLQEDPSMAKTFAVFYDQMVVTTTKIKTLDRIFAETQQKTQPTKLKTGTM